MLLVTRSQREFPVNSRSTPMARPVLNAGQPRPDREVLTAEGKGADPIVNVASANPSNRLNALLLETDRGLGLQATLEERGCSVHAVTSRSAVGEALDGADFFVISASGVSDDDVLELVKRAGQTPVLVVTENTDLAVRAAKLGATPALGGSLELAAAQIAQSVAMIDLKRKVNGRGNGVSPSTPPSGVVHRRSTPLPKEATPDALDALIQAAEGLVPMHRFQRVYVDYALRRFGGNKVHTAAALGIDRRTIQRWARARAENGAADTDLANEAVS